jgi:hypothetical protein
MDTNLSSDILNADQHGDKKLPSGLNVLTILTFIGCAIGLLLSLFTKPLLSFSSKMIDKGLEKVSELPQKDVEKMVEAKKGLELILENSTVLTILGLVGVALCFYGALNMRKLKKDGFWIYVAGQIVPVVGSLAVVGMAGYQGGQGIASLVLPFVFIGLYATQRKYLVK